MINEGEGGGMGFFSLILLALVFLGGGGMWGSRGHGEGAAGHEIGMLNGNMNSGFNRVESHMSYDHLRDGQFGLQKDIFLQGEKQMINTFNTQKEVLENRYLAQKETFELKAALESKLCAMDRENEKRTDVILRQIEKDKLEAVQRENDRLRRENEIWRINQNAVISSNQALVAAGILSHPPVTGAPTLAATA